MFVVAAFYACSPAKQIAQSAKQNVIDAPALQTAHVGISIYEPATGKYWYNYQGDKYFVPASNTKLPTCYAAMRHLGDSLVGLRYGIPREEMFSNSLIVFQPTGDPTFLHKDFSNQPVLSFLKKELIDDNKSVGFMNTVWQDERWGSGWTWNDFAASYVVERSSFPVYGNVIEVTENENRDAANYLKSMRNYFTVIPSFFDSLINKDWQGSYFENGKFRINRKLSENTFSFVKASTAFKSQEIPFVTFEAKTSFNILNKLLGKSKFHDANIWPNDKPNNEYSYECPGCDVAIIHIDKWQPIHSQPTDSLLKIMMHRSDNFYAEQSLLMVSNEMLSVMNDEKIIDTLLKTDLKDLPQKPRWADGSGLSRYNLFTPQDFVFILNKMRTDFGMDRMKNILETGGTGTISNYYKAENGFIFAKTGTLSGVVALSGYLYTKKNKLLIFSVLVNNSTSSATAVRRDVEKFIEGVREKF